MAKALKRLMDIMAALAGLALLLPVLAVVAIIIRLTMGPPVFFRQRRPGYRGRPFTLVKLRSMREAYDSAGAALPDSERLTVVGRLIRATSLDELPQLWNVLRGDMSLVGPRPLLTEYLERYSPEQARRHEVKPGITGWAQVNGRNAVDWPERLAMDVWYVDNWSLWLDAKILALTLLKVLKREGVSAAGEATMSEFTGATNRGERGR